MVSANRQQQDCPLLNQIKKEFNIPTDAHLARFLQVTAPSISKQRYGVNPVTSDFILKVYDATGWSIEKIRSLIPDANAREQSEVFSDEDS